MLRVGLTGGLGSGKSAVAAVFAEGGAHVLYADEIGRALMQPGQVVYAEIVASFGDAVLEASGQLDRRAVAKLAFEGGRLAELNAIVHPAVLQAQRKHIEEKAAQDPNGIVVVESALIFEVNWEDSESASPGAALNASEHDGHAMAWRTRFDQLVLVSAPDELKIARYVARVAPSGASPELREQLARDAKLRLAAQIPDSEKAPLCDFVIENTGSLVILRRKAQAVLAGLRSRQIHGNAVAGAQAATAIR